MSEQQDQVIKEREDFFKYTLDKMILCGIPFLIGGGYVFRSFTGIVRDTADLDIYCKVGDYPKFLKLFKEEGFEVKILDSRWIAQVYKGDDHLDFIFNTVNGVCAVDDAWFEKSLESELFGYKVRFINPVEFIWCKMFMCDRYRFEGADVYHVMLKQCDQIDWKWLLSRMDHYWPLLFAHLMIFRFVYPSDQKCIPKWLIEELVGRMQDHISLPVPRQKVCRGPLISQTQYVVDIKEWNYQVLTYETV